MAADRAFATDARERGLDGWMDAFAPDAARLPQLGTSALRGLDAIRAADAALFADPAVRLVWDPVDAGAFADDRHGYTTGNYQLLRFASDGSSETLGSGRYVTWWRRDDGGRWRVILDTGAPDPPG
jgi:ketosteroid isomerase-like protein